MIICPKTKYKSKVYLPLLLNTNSEPIQILNKCVFKQFLFAKTCIFLILTFLYEIRVLTQFYAATYFIEILTNNAFPHLVMKTELCILLLLLASARGDDGCSERYEWRCGDVCINWTAVCMCGTTQIGIADYSWCCADNCTKDTSVRYVRGDGTCSTGTVLPLNQTCAGKSNNYPADKNRNFAAVRSHVAVQCSGDITACVPEQSCDKWNVGVRGENYYCYSHILSLCTGAPPLCPDGQDIAQCGHSSHACDMEHGSGGDYTHQCDSGECVLSGYRDNGQYNCASRHDESGDGDTADDDAGSDSDKHNVTTETHIQAAGWESCLVS